MAIHKSVNGKCVIIITIIWLQVTFCLFFLPVIKTFI